MQRIFALVGPTAVGKTDVSIELAKRLSAEIVGCDSMQVYRGMPVLTQQPSPEQRAAVPHHLIDCVEPSELFSVGRYRMMALETVAAIQRRGKSVLIVGGTGLYLKALTDGLCAAPPADRRIRERLWHGVQREGSEPFHRRLREVDPEAATKLHPRDAKRIVRALEVYELTGEPLSWFWQKTNGHTLDVAVIGLTRNRQELYDRINRRVERMIREEGIVEEAKRVLALPLSLTARQVHGLRFLEAYLKGEADLPMTITQWQKQVRNYARRQLIWFRAVPRIHWVHLALHETPKDVADRILNELASGEVAEWLSGKTPRHFVTLPPRH